MKAKLLTLVQVSLTIYSGSYLVNLIRPDSLRHHLLAQNAPRTFWVEVFREEKATI